MRYFMAFIGLLLFTACTVPAEPDTGRADRRSDRTSEDHLERANELAGEVTDFMEDLASTAVREVHANPPSLPSGPSTYDRDSFGPAWADTDGNSCNTRDDVLAQELSDLVVDEDGCAVLSGTYSDPYTGEVLYYERGRSVIDIDHLVPLSWAWSHGAASWTDAQRESFANDFSNLRAADMGANRSKGDRGPSEWLPPNSAYHCTYVSDFIEVAEAYELAIPTRELRVRDLVCS